MEYYLDSMDARRFQRLVNSIFVSRLGDGFEVTPLVGADGGKDGESDSERFTSVFDIKSKSGKETVFTTGRTILQVKHHTIEGVGSTAARNAVLSDLRGELIKNILPIAEAGEDVNFVLVTNVPSSDRSMEKMREILRDVVKNRRVHISLWWKDRLVALLDSLPQIWHAFPEIFAGGRVPTLASVFTASGGDLPRAVRMAMEAEYRRDSLVKFRQIQLEQDITKLFTETDLLISHAPEELQKDAIRFSLPARSAGGIRGDVARNAKYFESPSEYHGDRGTIGGLSLLTHESGDGRRRYLIEGGPGFGKSTLAQVVLQIYRARLLDKKSQLPEEYPWPSRVRIPLKIELRQYADYLAKDPEYSVDRHVARQLGVASGGAEISVNQLHDIIQDSAVMMVFDGLDEVGNDDLRDRVLVRISECISRFESLGSDVKVIVTTRPPAIAGKRGKLEGFLRFPIAPLSDFRVESYVSRWLEAQEHDSFERIRIATSFERRRVEPHVVALVKNPMQLSVLLGFIKIKGEAFPSNRSKLYRDYFGIVIDRDVEKSTNLNKKRSLVESLHSYLGYKIHALAESEDLDGTLERSRLLEITRVWLGERGEDVEEAEELFALGEDRLGLIVAASGEGRETKYGFEVQPVREYFAAAYFNEQIAGDANSVFQEIARRPFWREVALFLAGLRRDNEKADLISRLAYLDADANNGWRQDGRAITLLLLKEGVFSEPPYAFQQAMDFLLDALDPEQVPIQFQQSNIANSLNVVLKEARTNRYVGYLVKLMEKYSDSLDEVVVENISELLYWNADLDTLVPLINKVSGGDEVMASKMKWYWPSMSRIDMTSICEARGYWDSSSPAAFSTAMWNSLEKSAALLTVEVPDKIIYDLASQYIYNPSAKPYFAPYSVISLLTNHSSALYRLIGFEMLFSGTIFRPIRREKMLSMVKNIGWDEDITYQGFTGNEIDIVKLALELIRNICDMILEDTTIEVQVSNIQRMIDVSSKSYDRSSGISYRVIENILRGYEIVERVRNNVSIISADGNIMFFDAEVPEIRDLEYVYHRFHLPIGHQNRRSVKEAVNLIPVGYEDTTWRAYRSYPDVLGVPGGSRNIVDVRRDIFKGSVTPHEWLRSTPIYAQDIYQIIESDIYDLEPIMRGLGGANIIGLSDSVNLNHSVVKKIIAIIDRSQDVEVLSGAITAIVNSRFLKSIKFESLIRLAKNGRRNSRQAFECLFATSMYSNSRPEDAEVLFRLAIHIKDNHANFPFSMVSNACRYLLGSQELATNDLVSIENSLGLMPRSR